MKNKKVLLLLFFLSSLTFFITPTLGMNKKTTVNNLHSSTKIAAQVIDLYQYQQKLSYDVIDSMFQIIICIHKKKIKTKKTNYRFRYDNFLQKKHNGIQKKHGNNVYSTTKISAQFIDLYQYQLVQLNNIIASLSKTIIFECNNIKIKKQRNKIQKKQ